jgi:hypothetical protein
MFYKLSVVVQNKVLKLLLAYIVSLSGEEPDIASLSMLSFLHKFAIANLRCSKSSDRLVHSDLYSKR